MNQLGDIVDTATSAAGSVIPGASFFLPDPPWYKTWWGMGLIGAGGLLTLGWLILPRRPTYVIVRR